VEKTRNLMRHLYIIPHLRAIITYCLYVYMSSQIECPISQILPVHHGVYAICKSAYCLAFIALFSVSDANKLTEDVRLITM